MSPSTASCGIFSQLLAELRLQVYELVCLDISVKFSAATGDHTGLTKRGRFSGTSIGILGASKTIPAELNDVVATFAEHWAHLVLWNHVLIPTIPMQAQSITLILPFPYREHSFNRRPHLPMDGIAKSQVVYACDEEISGGMLGQNADLSTSAALQHHIDGLQDSAH
jgi:hypothetical protein